MKTINCLGDLDPFGIHPLTGEADALGFRCLCDVTEAGRRLMAETFGLKPDCCQGNWNPGGDSQPHVGSVMLPNDAWRALGIVALVSNGYHTVITTEDGKVWGFERGEQFRRAEYELGKDEAGREDYSMPLVLTAPAKVYRDGVWMDWPSCYGTMDRIFQFGDHPRQGTRNLHAISGRST